MVISENCCTFIVLNYKVVQTIIAMFFTSFRRRRNTEDKVTEIFFMADEFHKVFCRMLDKYSVNAPKISGKRSYHRAGRLTVPEIMTIMILFHNSGYRCLKHFYLNEVCVNLRHLFPQVVSYNRFVELEKEAVIPLTIFIKKVLLGKFTGISFVDSTPLRVCKFRLRLNEVKNRASISIRLSKVLQPEASARWDGFSVSSCT